MYSGYRPQAGYNLTHIANRTYLDHLVNEMAPHVWSRRWTDVQVTDLADGALYNLHFCAKSPLSGRGMKEACIVPHTVAFDTEHGSQSVHAPPAANGTSDGANSANESSDAEAVIRAARRPKDGNEYRLAPRGAEGGLKLGMRAGGWGRQKPIVVMAALPGKHHVYCKHEVLSPADDWLYRNCALLKASPWGRERTLRAELVVHLGTGDLPVGAVDCDGYERYGYTHDRVPPCAQLPWG